MNPDVTVIILTMNEELNLPHALQNVRDWSSAVFVLDSGSTDRTCEIVEEMGATLFHHPFEDYGSQRNFALSGLPIQTEWVLFLDADETLTEDLKHEITATLPTSAADGYLIPRRFYFMGRWIRHGGYYPTWILRLFRHRKGLVKRSINEHVEVEGEVSRLTHDLIDRNHKGLSEWIEKHNRYSDMEARQLQIAATGESAEPQPEARLLGDPNSRKQWIRQNIWNPLLPPLLRPFLYYFYRYVIRLGFLDGLEGFIYHLLQGFWFFFLIDAKYLQLRRQRESGTGDEGDRR